MNLLPNMALIADSLGWAVLHSLWQGALAGCIVYGVRNLTRERASEARYFTGIVTLCALLCAFIGTFIYYYMTGAEALSLGLGREETINLALPSVVDAAATNPLLKLADYTSLIGMFWTACFAVLGMRYLSAFRITHKLRTNGISDLTEDCQARFRALVEASGVTPKVRAYFSDHVSSPITFGFLKPIVLVPTWFFTGMTPEQCEAVLLHELAHIRRHDYLTNILQIAIKTVFFYHPAVGFICKGLDADREHACDDFAVMLTKNPEGLATALGTIRLKAARDGGVFALSASGSAGGRDAPLMHRLKRLMGTENKSMQSGTSRGLAATVMIGSALALIMTLGATVSQAHPHKPDAVIAPGFEKPAIDELAGAATPKLDTWSDDTQKEKKKKKKKISVNGKTYKATSFDFSTDGNGTDIINGKEYPSKYAYSVYTRDGAKDGARNGESYVVKHKNGKRYMEIGDNWYRVDSNNNKSSFAVPTPPTPPTPPKVSANNYWVSDKVLAATEARLVRAAESREEALERADIAREKALKRAEKSREKALKKSGKQRERELERVEEELELAMERAEEAREEAWEQAEDQREAAMERAEDLREAALERAEDARERAAEQREAALERAQEQRERATERREASLERASDQREQYSDMRDRLIPQLTADGYMKSDNSKVTIKMTPTDIFINGKKLANAQEGKYCDIVSDYMNHKDGVNKIVIKSGYLHVSEKGDGHDNTLTIKDNH